MTSVFSWQNSVSLCPASILYSKAILTCYFRYLLTSYFCILVPYDEKDIFFFGVNSRWSVGHHKTVQLQLLWHYWLGHRLGLLWYWMVCLGNEQIILSWLRDFTFTFHCILDSFVDHKSYSISSKGFLSTVIDREEGSFAELQFGFLKKKSSIFFMKIFECIEKFKGFYS